MGIGPDCERYSSCKYADIRCEICKNFSCYKPGKNMGKGAHHERKVKKVRDQKAHLRKGSGSVAHAKGDIIDDKILHEAKSGYSRVDGKGNTIFSLKRSWLLKIAREALVEDRLPVLELHFDNTPDEEIYSVIPAQTLFEIVQDNTDKDKTIKNLEEEIYQLKFDIKYEEKD